jgi:hypothetical protein
LIEDLIENGDNILFSVSSTWQTATTKSPSDKRLTPSAFCTPHGTFEWTAMPMGLGNAGATFQRVMHSPPTPWRFM